MRPRVTRPLFAFVLFAALFGGACTTALVPVKLAAQDQPQPAQPKSDQPKPAQPEEKQPAPVPGGFEDMRPAGDDAWFTPLPIEGLHEGEKPANQQKAVLIDVPFEDSWNDNPVDDLPESARVAARGLRLALELHLDYLPGVYQYLPQTDAGAYLARVRGYQAALRFGDARGLAVGARSKSLDGVCRRFGADQVFATVYTKPAEIGAAASAQVVRYSRAAGVQAAVTIALGKPDKNSLVTALGAAAADLCRGVAMSGGDELRPLTHAQVPGVAADDGALRLYVQMRQLIEQGELTQAWVKYEDFKKRDSANGRASLWALEIFRGFADKQTEAAERTRYLQMVIETARAGLKAAPNDVVLRGRLCRLVSLWFKRDAWCLEGLRQALRVQPANAHVLDWHVTIEHALDRQKQAQWLESTALPLLRDGVADYLVATAYFGGGQFEQGTLWYRKAVAKSPHEHEFFFSLGLCATYLGESLQKAAAEPARIADAFATAAEAMVAAQRLDPTPMGWLFEYHPRSATRSFKLLPANPDDLERVMLSQAVVNGLQPTSKTGEWDRLTVPVIATQRRLLRAAAKEAKPDNPDYEVWLMARLQFALVDRSEAEIGATLKIMRKLGHRSPLYDSAATQFATLLE